MPEARVERRGEVLSALQQQRSTNVIVKIGEAIVAVVVIVAVILFKKKKEE